MSDPRLASGLAVSGSVQVASLAAPSLSPAGDDVLLVGLVGISSVTPRTMTPPAGWTKDVEVSEINSPHGTNSTHRLSINHRLVGAAAPPYADVFTASGAAWWGIEQLAFRSLGAQPDNHGSAHAQYEDTDPVFANRGETNPTLSALLDSGADAGMPTAGYVLVAAFAVDGLGGPYTGDGLFHFPGDWTYLGETGGIWGFGRIGFAFKVADGTETGIGDTYYGSNRIGMAALVVAEFRIDPEPVTTPVGWDVYAAAEPNATHALATIQQRGATVDTAGIEGATERSVRVALNETGSGTFKINRYSSVATEAILARGNFVKCRFPWRSDYDVGFWLEKGDFTLAARDEKGGEEFTFGGRGALAYLDRAVMDAVAYTTGLDVVDKFTEIWHTTAVKKPVGIAFVTTDPDYVYEITLTDRRIRKLRQSDRKVVRTSPELWTGSTKYPGGLTEDPGDDTVLWALESPSAFGGSGNTKIRKIRISDWAILSTTDLGSAIPLTDIRASTGFLWTTRYDTGKIQRRTMAAPGTVDDDWTVTYNGNAQTHPFGVGISESGTGTEIAMWFGNSGGAVKRALVADLADPSTVTRTINTSSIASYGGAWSQEGGSDFFYMVNYALGTTWKYQLTAATPHDPVDLKWRLDEGSPGAILWRVIQEAQAVGRPQQPLPDLTYDFTSTLDSAAAAWSTHDGTTEFDAEVTESVLNVALRLLPYGLVEQMSPYLNLVGRNAADYGTDRTGAVFGAGVVRFEKGVNIIPELARQDRERELHSHMLAIGKGGLYARATLADLGYVREGGIKTDIEDATALGGTAEARLDDERVKSERIRFAVPIGDDVDAGKYLPFTHYNVGDLVTLHTGTGEHDFNGETFLLYAFTLTESKAGHFEKAILELGSASIASPTADTGSTSAGSSSVGGNTTIVTSSPITVEAIDDTGTTVSSAIGSKIRIAGVTIYQEGAGIIRAIVAAANRLLGLDDVNADDIVDGQILVYDEAAGEFVPGDLPGGGGGVIAIPYTFSTTTTDSDPGDGILRLSNASQYLAVTARADLTDALGADVTALLDAITSAISTTKGYLRIAHATDSEKWLVATVSAVASPAGYRNITIANIAKSSNSPLADGDPILLSFDTASLAHQAAHNSGGADALQLDNLAAPDDNTDLNASAAAHGLLPKLSGNATDRLAGDGSWTAGAGAAALAASTGDVTTTAALADVTGCSLSLSPGTYVIVGSFDVLVNTNADRTFEGHLDVGGADQTKIATIVGVGLDTSDRVESSQFWLVTVGVTTTVKLRVKHSGGAAGDFTAKGNTTIAAWTAGTTTPLSKYDATTAPTVNEDSGDGYSVGSRWIDTTNDRAWICVDATVGAAVWLLGPSGGASGAWISYNPTWTGSVSNPAIGNGSIAGHYRYLDSKTIVVRIRVTAGSTTTYGSGNYSFSLPLTTDSIDDQTIPGRIFDASSSQHYMIVGNINSASTSIVRAGSNGNIMNPTTPLTLASGDQIRFQGVIGIA